MINFDNSATSFPKPAAVKKAVLTALSHYGGNPGRSGHTLSLKTAEAVYKTRSSAADFFGTEVDNVIFTQNCTHALNMAIKGVAEKGCHIIISNLEHNSVLRPVHALSLNNSCSYSIAEINHDDFTTVENFRKLITPKTKIVVCTLGSNVTGQITPYRQIADLCKKHGICFIADGAQACGVIPIKLSDGINILCTAGHKSLYGPSGTGLLVTDGKYTIKPLMEGGTGSTSLEAVQPDFLPDALESGTVNTAGIIGLGAGIEFVKKIGIDKIYEHETTLCRKFIIEMQKIPKVIIYNDVRYKNYLPVVSFNVNDYTANQAAEILNNHGFALRGGLHCSGLAHTSIGTAPDGTIRFSPSIFNKSTEVESLVKIIKNYLT